MKMSSSNLPENEELASKPKQQRPELEPHELAGQLTKDQMGDFAIKLLALAKRKAASRTQSLSVTVKVDS